MSLMTALLVAFAPAARREVEPVKLDVEVTRLKEELRVLQSQHDALALTVRRLIEERHPAQAPGMQMAWQQAAIQNQQQYAEQSNFQHVYAAMQNAQAMQQLNQRTQAIQNGFDCTCVPARSRVLRA